ncbi:peptidylprolyl isomerase [Paramagnetospirillum marisnigri]|uniref:Peptidyl-prolyl cis-trans isomerase n=1 Tax=Paramagnetospirillum marisnigri TaxID=1285242 RepID=A0A178M5F6_9PROT|nr:peptidylprolyl isomerase [Paramagnetospirillum marisnigri]OAN43982.1 peptidylprolyl isomerase [Paramagnetospirillum marisnigri]
MTSVFKRFALALAALALSALHPALAAGPDDTWVLELSSGKVVIEFRNDLAPHHVARIKELTRKGFYDGTPFHRVIAGFMAQGGDPTGTGSGGSGTRIRAEFTGEPFVRGVVGMARSGSPDSADSQFFIMLGSAPSLDGKYTAFGRVLEGMEFVDRIKKGDAGDNGIVSNPDKLLRAQILADVKK